jgi:hypothetical protein
MGVMTDIAEQLLDLRCEGASDSTMYEFMRANGVDESEQPSLLADADMSHQKMLSLERDLQQLQKDHQQLQKDHQQLQNEREVEARAKDDVHRALQNLLYEPFSDYRSGFEMHRILYGN